MGSCLCKDKKSISSNSLGYDDEIYSRSTRGVGRKIEYISSSGTYYPAEPNDRRNVTEGTSHPEYKSRENNVSFRGGNESLNTDDSSNECSLTQIASQSKYKVLLIIYMRFFKIYSLNLRDEIIRRYLIIFS